MSDNSWRARQEGMVAGALKKGLRTVLLIDTETTGLDPAEGATCIEVACQRLDLELRQPVDGFHSLIHCEGGNPAEHVNGIPTKLVERAPKADVVWKRVAKMISGSDLIISHRVEFDYMFFPKDLREQKPWCCSKFDIEWPRGKNGDDLLHLAIANGCAVASAHRAMSDVEVLSRIFMRVMEQHDIDEMFRRALRPKKKVISLAHFLEKDTVKQNGFAWDADNKIWYKWMPAEDIGKLPFKTKISPD